ncbi:MAG: Dabb family protein, partial [Clostridia bacterium]|nr:Dabb family protein [Clostridia bacterium]
MVTHIVFWNVRNDEKKQENMEHMKEILTALVGKVDGLLSAEVGFSFNPKGYDLALYS